MQNVVLYLLEFYASAYNLCLYQKYHVDISFKLSNSLLHDYHRLYEFFLKLYISFIIIKLVFEIKTCVILLMFCALYNDGFKMENYFQYLVFRFRSLHNIILF